MKRNRLLSLIEKEWIQFIRDRVLFVTALTLPIVLILLLGNAISSAFSENDIAVIDSDHSPLSRQILAMIESSHELEVTAITDTLEEAQRMMDRKLVSGILIIPPSFSDDIASSSEQPALQVLIDGSQILRATITIRSISLVLTEIGTNLVDIPVVYQRGGIVIYPDLIFNPEIDYRYESITSMAALIVFTVTILIAIMTIVREKEVGTIEMISITPLTQWEMIAGKAFVPLSVGFFNFLTVYLVMRVAFDIPARGSFALLLGVTLCYLACETAFALLVSAALKSQHQAVTFAFIWIMVGLCFSGYFVDIETLPMGLRTIAEFIPLRHYMAIIKAIMLKGASMAHVWPHFAAILAMGGAIALAASRILKRTTG